MPSVTAKFMQNSKLFFKHNQIHLPRLNSALMPAWIEQTWQWKVIDYFLGFTRALLPEWEWKCDFFSSSLLISLFCRFTLKDAGCVGNLCVCAAACSQTRCSLWYTGNEELLAHRHCLQHRTWHNAYKRHSTHLFEDGSFCSVIFKWLLNSAVWSWGHI